MIQQYQLNNITSTLATLHQQDEQVEIVCATDKLIQTFNLNKLHQLQSFPYENNDRILPNKVYHISNTFILLYDNKIQFLNQLQTLGVQQFEYKIIDFRYKIINQQIIQSKNYILQTYNFQEEEDEDEDEEENITTVTIIDIQIITEDLELINLQFNELTGQIQLNKNNEIQQKVQSLFKDYQVFCNQVFIDEQLNLELYLVKNILVLFNNQIQTQQIFRITNKKVIQIETTENEIDEEIQFNIIQSQDKKYLIFNKYINQTEYFVIFNPKTFKTLKYLSYQTEQQSKQVLLQNGLLVLFFDDKYVQIDLKTVTEGQNYVYYSGFKQAFPLDEVGLQYLILKTNDILIVDNHKLITKRSTPQNIDKVLLQNDSLIKSETLQDNIVILSNKQIQLIDLRNSEIIRSVEFENINQDKQILTFQDYVFVVCQYNDGEQYIQMIDIIHNKKIRTEYHACDSQYKYEELKQWVRKRYSYQEFESELIKTQKYQIYFENNQTLSQIVNYTLNPSNDQLYMLTNTSLTIFSIQDGKQLFGRLITDLTNILFPQRKQFQLIKNSSQKTFKFDIQNIQNIQAFCINKSLNLCILDEKETNYFEINQQYDFIVQKSNILICFKQNYIDIYQIQYNQQEIIFQHLNCIQNIKMRNFYVYLHEQNIIFYWDNKIYALNVINSQLYLIQELSYNIQDMNIVQNDIVILTDKNDVFVYKLLDQNYWKKIESMDKIQENIEDVEEEYQYVETENKIIYQLLEQVQNAINNPIKYRQNKKQVKKYNDDLQGFTFQSKKQENQILIDKDLVFMQKDEIQKLLDEIQSQKQIYQIIQLWWIINYANYDIIYKDQEILNKIKQIISKIDQKNINSFYKYYLEAQDIINNLQ